MRRFSFFIAVFSIGLVLFLLLTGQFGKLFQGAGGDRDTATETTDAPESPFDAVDENIITYHNHDYDRGRIRFTIRGSIDGSSELNVSPQAINQQRTLSNAQVEIPIYPAATDRDPTDTFVLDAERVDYSPREEDSGDRILLEGRIHGQGRSGFPVFETENVELTFAVDESARLEGQSRVQVEYPAVVLRGQNGFVGNIATAEGLRTITVEPPLVVALSPDEDGSILGFRGGAVMDRPGGGESRTRVHLYSEGPMTIDREAGTADFVGPVFIYEVPEDTSLQPPAPEDLPANRFRCEKLRLALDPVSRRVTQLIAERVEDPVTVFLADGYRVEGNQLVWSDGEQEAVLTGDVRIVGEIGEFGAGVARVKPEIGRCWLTGGITARVRGAALEPGGDGELRERLGGDWILDGDRAELHYSRAEENQELELFRALAAPGERVRIREERDGGAVVLGGEMRYSPGDGTIQVLAGDEPGAERPDFRDGENVVFADRVDLALARPVLEFHGSVQGTIVDPPVDTSGEWPEWLGEGEDSRTEIAAERVRFSWDDENRLERVEAWRGEEPLDLAHHAEDSFRLRADSMEWEGARAEILARGEGLQTLSIEDRAELTARSLNFATDRRVMRGDGDVVFVARRPAPRGREGPAPHPVTIEGDHVEVRLQPEDAEVTAGDDPLKVPELIDARGWSDADGSLTIEEGSFRAIGRELMWDTVEGVVRLHGPGRQRVLYRGPEGLDEISAESLVYRSSDRTLVLEGETRARIHQGSVTSGGSEDADQYRNLPWDLTAANLVATFREDPEEKDALLLDRVIGSGGVVLTQEVTEIEFRGDDAEWDATTERLRVYSPEGRGHQTLYRGRVDRDELVAREILLVRPPKRRAHDMDRVEVLFIDVLSATIHLDDGGAKETPEHQPETFVLRADNLLLSLSGDPEEKVEGQPSLPIDEARAWGNVDFRGGDFRVDSHRSIFRRSTRTVYFQGQGDQKVQVLVKGRANIPAANEMEIEWTPGRGYRVKSRPAGGQWSSRRIEETLEMFGQEDREQ